MTKEESKKQVIEYLTKNSNHVFSVKKNQYSSDDRVYLKVIKTDEGNFKVLDNGRVRDINVDRMVDYYGGNAKNIIKQSLFLNRKAESVRQTKYVTAEINKQLEALNV